MAKRQRLIWLRVGILLAMFVLALTSLRDKSPTFDEQGFLTRGVAYLRGENRQLRVGHPLGLNAINSFLLSLDRQVALPTDDPSWQGTNFHRPSELFLWEIGNDVNRVMFQGRLPTIWLGMLMVALAGRWAWELTRREAAGVLALLFLALDPNILAHSRLATTDLGLAAAALLAGYAMWQFWKKPGWQRALLAGGTFGLLLNTKFTAGLFVPLFALVILIAVVDRWWTGRHEERSGFAAWRPLLMLVVCYPAAAFLVLWASYGFQVGTLPDSLPVATQLGGTTWPASHYLEQLLDIGGRMQKSTPAFLLGEYSDSGWWYYFPVTFVLKTPVAALILLAWALTRLILCWLKRLQLTQCLTTVDVAALLVPAAGYFIFALTTDINLGFRHLLPIVPFLSVFTAAMLSGLGALTAKRRPVPRLGRLALLTLVVTLAAATLLTYPHFLAYFNVLAGGPDKGWQALVDSNIDWGQDLAGLQTWTEEYDKQKVYLSYFGEARPEYYGIGYVGLDSFPPRLMNPQANPLHPSAPAPGTYAISATTLQGVHFEDHDEFAWFRSREPEDKIGYSIFIYEVPSSGPAADVVLGGLQFKDVEASAFSLWESNDVTAHWIDPSQSLLVPDSSRAWLAIASDAVVHPRIAAKIGDWESTAENADYVLYKQPAGFTTSQEKVATFSSESGDIVLNEIVGGWRDVKGGDVLQMETSWTKHGPESPVKLFVHITDASGSIVAQWDGLGVSWEGWRDGDGLYQLHELSLPADLAPGTYRVWLGVYDPSSGLRWVAEGGDRWLAGEIVVGQ